MTWRWVIDVWRLCAWGLCAGVSGQWLDYSSGRLVRSPYPPIAGYIGRRGTSNEGDLSPTKKVVSHRGPNA